jgi:capsular polysaccharide export protein
MVGQFLGGLKRLFPSLKFQRFWIQAQKPGQWFSLISRRLQLSPTAPEHQFAATSMDLVKSDSVRTILSLEPVFYSRLLKNHQDVIIGWGMKRSGKRAVSIATEAGSDFFLLEDGFLRSVKRSDPALSLVMDNFGIYYDSKSPSKIEHLIAASISANEKKRVAALIHSWRELQLSKYNSSAEYSGEIPQEYVLVLDQVAGDMSIGYGQADQFSFDRMLRCALQENPEATVIVKTHPDVFTRAKSGHFDIEALKTMPRVQIITESCHPVRLIEHADVVYTVTSQVGFEALIWGKKVRCFGMPFYAGWGLTEDDLPAPQRRGTASLEQLVHAALIKYPRYIDRERQVQCEAETVMEHIGLQRRMMFRFPGQIFALGFSRWKHPHLRRFLSGSEINFGKRPADMHEGATVAVWGNDLPTDAPASVKFLQVEDGFLRSSGLGADLVQPLSWVIDDLGIYYDASKPSRLEVILQLTEFEADLLKRARNLREKLITLGVTKYNLGGETWTRPSRQARVILVPGQVENDASIRFGTKDVRTNLGLAKTVRAENPDAYIVYKSHPDIVAGLRHAGVGENEVEHYCDEIVHSGDTVQMLSQVDEVHTMTSLLGFEALIRGTAVTCYGLPFYSGWGLTRDIHPSERRTRRLSLDELVAGALILYPTYVSRVTNVFATPELAIEELVEWRNLDPSRIPVWRRVLRRVVALWAASGFKRNA